MMAFYFVLLLDFISNLRLPLLLNLDYIATVLNIHYLVRHLHVIKIDFSCRRTVLWAKGNKLNLFSCKTIEATII